MSRLGLLAQIPNYEFVVPDHVPEEITLPEQRTTLDAAVTAAWLKLEVIDDLGAITVFTELIAHIGRGEDVTAAQIAEGRRLTEIVCVQNHYNLVHRRDDPVIDELAALRIAYVPFFPLGGFAPLQSSTLSAVSARLGATPMQVALAWLSRRSPNVLLIPGTSSIAHLRENLASASLVLNADDLAELDGLSPVVSASS